MESLKSRYSEIVEERQQIINELKTIEENELLKRYFELRQKNNDLLNQQKKLIKEIRNEEFKTCNHIFVISKYDYDSFEGRSQKFHGCIKCGLNQEVLSKARGLYGTDFFTFEEQIMYEFIKDRYINGIHLNVLCDLDLAKSIYSKIKENYPNIKDETVCKYFEIALDDIRDKKASEESKGKRLSLRQDFNE